MRALLLAMILSFALSENSYIVSILLRGCQKEFGDLLCSVKKQNVMIICQSLLWSQEAMVARCIQVI